MTLSADDPSSRVITRSDNSIFSGGSERVRKE